jgi:hypothetical protein
MSPRAALGLAALVAAAAWPGGPLAFVPPLLRWPLVAAAVLPLLRGPSTTRGREAAAGAELPVVAVALAVYVLLKVPGIHPSQSDENVYFYLASRVAAGELPYRDFFFAHPPLHLVVPAAIFRVAGFSVGLAKALPVAAQGAAALLLWGAARTASRPYALAALVVHLTAYQVLMGASDMNGANLAALFLAGGLLAAVRGAPLAAGALAGLGVGTVLYALAGAAAVGVTAALHGGRRGAARFAAGLSGAVLLVLGAAWAVGRGAFLHGVFGYHGARPVAAGRAPVLGEEGVALAGGYLHNLADTAGDGWRALYFHAPLAAALCAGAILLAADAWRRRGVRSPAPPAPAVPVTAGALAGVGVAGAVLSLLQAAALPEVHAFYALPAMPFVALAAAWGPVALAARLARGERTLPVAAAALVLGAQPLLARVALPRAFPDEAGASGAAVRYPWPDPDVPAPLARASRALLWSGERDRGAVEPPWRHAVWSKSAAFASARALAAHVRASSTADETITGASTLAPLVALLADRRMAAGEADTNTKRFRAGSLDEADFLARVLADRCVFVVEAPRSFFTSARLEADPRWAAAFERDRAFRDDGLRRGEPASVILYRSTRLSAPPSSSGR